MAELLSLDGVTAGYGASVVLEGISLALDDGDSLALLGRNGVGKSTLLVTLMGLTRLHRGALRWRGTDLTALSTYQRAQAGIGWVPQERYMWPSLTIEEHLTAVARPGQWTLRRISPRCAMRCSPLRDGHEFLQRIRIAQEVVARSAMDHASPVEHDRLPCQRQGELRVLLDDDDRHAPVGHQVADHLHKILDDDRRQSFHRLVEQQEPRIDDQCTCDCQHLLLAAG